MKTNKLIPAVLLLTCVTSFMLYVTRVNAQEAVNITFYPTKQDVTINPGETKRVAVAFVNNEFYPVQGNLKVVDFVVRDNNVPKLIEDTTLSTRYSAASWVTLPYTEATLPVNDRLIVYADVTAPKDALPGGHYAAIYFETTANTQTNTTAQKSGQAVVTHQFGSLISFTVPGDVKTQAKVFDFSTNNFQEHGPVQVTTKILNEGYIHITPVGTISLYNSLGSKVAQQKLTPTNIFPEALSKYENEFGSKWMFGRYRVMLNATYADNKPLMATAYVWILPWKESSVVILAIIIIALLMKNIIKKSRVNDERLESKLEEDRSEIEKLKEELRKRD